MTDTLATLATGPVTTETAAADIQDPPQPKKRFVPEGHTETDRLISVRTLLMQGRSEEALERLNIVLDRFHDSWRVGSPQEGSNHKLCRRAW